MFENYGFSKYFPVKFTTFYELKLFLFVSLNLDLIYLQGDEAEK